MRSHAEKENKKNERLMRGKIKHKECQTNIRQLRMSHDTVQ